ncbi:MAG: hypothetical protein U0X92_16670, partial [Anaerolineales bacterium]
RDTLAFANVNDRVQRLDAPAAQLIENFLKVRYRKRGHYSSARICLRLLQNGEVNSLEFAFKVFPDLAVLSFFKGNSKRFPIEFSQPFGVRGKQY